MFEVQHRDDRFPLKEWVLGVEVNGSTKAYPFSVLARRVDARGELVDSVGGQRLRVRYDAAHGSAEAFDAEGRSVPDVMAFWFAWVAFHPRTEVLRAP
jgi:YD repeat-containing protein